MWEALTVSGTAKHRASVSASGRQLTSSWYSWPGRSVISISCTLAPRELLVEKVPSDFISVDEYPFFSIALLKGLAFRLCLHTYDVVASACRESGRDFWLYLQTQGNWFDGIYALPSYGQIRWQGGNIECQDRFGAHRVDIRNAVGSRDGAIGVGVIHNRREEVGCQDYRCMLV